MSPLSLIMVDAEYLKELIEKKLSGSEQFLVEVKLSSGKLSVFIDKPSGITVEECTSMNRFLSKELEENGFTETHEIEVSSPGMDQPLKVLKQYQRRIGANVKVTTVEGKLLKGKLLSASDDGFELLETIETKENKKKVKHENNLRLNYSEIKETKLEF